MLGTTTEGRRHDAVASDRYDALDHTIAVDNIDRLAQAEERLAAVHDAAVDIGQDLFSSFFKPAPRLRDDDELRADRRINRAVVESAMNTEAYKDVRRYTVGDRTSAGLAVTTIAETVEDLYRKIGPELDEKVADAQAADEEVDALLDRLAAAEADSEEACDLQDAVAEAQEKAQAAAAALDDAIDSQQAAIGRAVRKGAKLAAEKAEAEADTFGGWGMDRAAMSRMDPKQRIALSRRLNSERLRRIAALFGRLRNLSWAKRKSQWDTLPEEVFDVIVGVTDPTWILPAELMLLADEDVEDLFWSRFVQGELMGYRLRGRTKVTQGGIILCKDGSGSMVGDRDIFASAIGMALLGVAHDEKRAFHGIQFGGPGVLESVSFPSPAEFTTERMLRWAELAANIRSGTCFQTPLDEAVRLLANEHAATGRVTGDIVFLTDGEAKVSDAWLYEFKAEQERLGFRVFGIAVGGEATSATLTAITDGRVFPVRDVHSGRDIDDLFRTLAA